MPSINRHADINPRKLNLAPEGETIGLHCPKCDHATTDVIDSRPHSGGYIRRRRKCARCAHRFSTFEFTEGHSLLRNTNVLRAAATAALNEFIHRYNELAKSVKVVNINKDTANGE